ncbi:gamma-butyrobetaine dioxygenase-like [Diadema antillarum]|uniref:gamma-butyrobetaine dioxygenase-like n=1 Tax=Diadema antillarum TaxID=105358 RepID=UPI003A8623CC
MVDSSSIVPQAFEDESVLHASWPRDDYDNAGKTSTSITRVVARSTTIARSLTVFWDEGLGGASQDYPYVWLRDHCRCPKCFHAGFQTRLSEFKDFDIDIDIKDVVIGDDGRSLSIRWSDDHRSQYSSKWLFCNRFDRSEGEPVRSIEPELWEAESMRMRTFNYSDIVESDTNLYDMLVQLKTVGVAVISGTPPEKGYVSKLSERIGYLTVTSYGTTSNIYGKEEWAFGHPSYGLEYRPLHTDYSFCQDPPGIFLLHCIDQIKGDGGEYFFVDGFKAALDLKQLDPDAFDRLTVPCWESRVKGWVVNDRHYHYSRHAPITLNQDRSLAKIICCDFWKTSVMRLPVGEVDATYRAMKSFHNLMYEEKRACRHTLRPGDVLIFDNRRILHGREAYRDTAPSQVHLETCYFGWDSVDSRLRKLKMTLAK